jgi:HSP20 family protein
MSQSIFPTIRQSSSLFGEEGRLSVDVFPYRNSIYVVAPMAGVDTTSIDIHIHNDVLTIRGVRTVPECLASATEMYHEECYWGPFSRTIVLPAPVISAQATADFSSGILTIMIPKQAQERRIPITIVEE